jgi:hypothetical protein
MLGTAVSANRKECLIEKTLDIGSLEVENPVELDVRLMENIDPLILEIRRPQNSG